VAAAIFLATVGLAAVGVFPISVAAVAGAAAMLLAKCLNIRQAVRALDRKVVLLVGASLALSVVMDKTGAARFLGTQILSLIPNPSPALAASVLFAIVAVLTNVLSNNACAVLFTPIAVGLAHSLNVSPTIMAMTVIFAANCSFAAPIGYQTNLLVMGPGHYRFRDFFRGGTPLLILLWITFCLVFPRYFGFSW
jgi:di/tricarboxylate transporter